MRTSIRKARLPEGGSGAGPPVDDRAHTDERLLDRYRRHGDLAARDELVERLLPLARQLASRYRHAGEPQEDLFQVACVGLMKALDRFEPERGSALANYAVPTMLGEIKRHFRDKSWALRVPRSTQELALKVGEALGALPTRLGRSPTARDVADAVDAPVEDVIEAMEAATAYEATSLDSPPPSKDAGEGAPVRGESIGREDVGYELVELREALGGTIAALPERERLILRLRFHEDMTQHEIADRVGLSQMHVSRLLRRSLDKLAAGAGTG
jgi:RNA polymerase sigma-B factor